MTQKRLTAEEFRAQRHKARGRRVQPGPGLNKTELAYQKLLDGQVTAGTILGYLPHGSIKLRLAKSTYYTADFPVLDADGYLELHEVKGHWEDDARVKIKVAAERYPQFRFVAIKRVRDVWQREEF